MSTFTDLVNAQLTIGDSHILWREIIGNGFGFASALGGLRRRVWAWPVGIVGNVLLFTVFLGAAFGTPQGQNLLGQAGRQVMFIVVSVYGWYAWRQSRGSGKPAVEPRWATGTEVRWMVFAGAVLVAVLTPTFAWIGSYDPVIADAWIFTGSLLATYAMARGWVDFWLCWIAVDLVGVPELLHFRYYPSAILYAVYAAFVIWGFVVWLRISRREQAPRLDDPRMQTVA